MNYLSFFITLFLISFSGAASPGPVTAYAVERGKTNVHAGLLIAIGHGIIEVPLILLLFAGIVTFFQNKIFITVLGLTGGSFLLYMGISILYKEFLYPHIFTKTARIKDIEKRPADKRTGTTMKNSGKSLIRSGILFSISNPYYFIWWATIGAALVSRVKNGTLILIPLFIAVHWSTDLIWFYFLSIVSYSGSRKFGEKFQKIISIVSALILIFFGLKFIYSAVRDFR